MKNIIKLTIWVFLGISLSYGQMPVTDAATNASLAASNALHTKNLAKSAGILAKTAATLETLNNMKKQYDKWEEDISEVTKYIAYGKQAMNISNMLDEVKETYSQSITLIERSNYLTPKAIQKVSYVFARLLGDCVEITSESIDVITSGTYKMSDAERLKLMKKYEEDLREKMKLMKYMEKKIQYAEQRAKTNEYNNSLFAKNTETFKY